jgi:hypothetical protein
VPARQIVEEIERDTDVLGRRAEVRIELGDVTRLGGDELLLLGGLGLRRAGERLRQRAGHAERCAPLSNSRRVTFMGCTSSRRIRVQLRSDTAVCGAGYSAFASACQGCQTARALRERLEGEDE